MKSKKIKIIVAIIALTVITTMGIVIMNRTGLLKNTNIFNNKEGNPLDKLIGMPFEDALSYVEELGYENWQGEPTFIETTNKNLDGKVESYDISNNTVFLNFYMLKTTNLNPHGLWASLSEDELAIIINYLEQKAKNKYKDRYLGYKVDIVDDFLYFSDIYATGSGAISFEGYGYYPKDLTSNWKKESIESLIESKKILVTGFNGISSHVEKSVAFSKEYNVSNEEIELAKAQLFKNIDLKIEEIKKSIYKEVSEKYRPYYSFAPTTIQSLENDEYNNKINNCLKETTLSANDDIFIKDNEQSGKGRGTHLGTYKQISDTEYVYFNSVCHKVKTNNWNEEPNYEYITYAVKYKMNIPYSLGVGAMTLEQLIEYKYIEIEEFEMPKAVIVKESELEAKDKNNYYEQYKTIFEKMNLPKKLLLKSYGWVNVGWFVFDSDSELHNGQAGSGEAEGRYKKEGEALVLTIFHRYEGEKDKTLKGKVLNDYFIEVEGGIYNCVLARDSYIPWIERGY